MNGRMLAKKILRIGYYWSTMETNYVDFVKSCHDYQTHANLNHVPPSELYNMTSPWPFSVWGIDVIITVALKALNEHEYILVAINYFTKWVEAASYSMLKAKHMARFIENNIICRYGVPKGSSRIMALTLRGRFKGLWSCITLSITSLHRIDHRLIVP